MTSIPASRRARAMILAPRSWPSRPGLATTTRILRAVGADGAMRGIVSRELEMVILLAERARSPSHRCGLLSSGLAHPDRLGHVRVDRAVDAVRPGAGEAPGVRALLLDGRVELGRTRLDLDVMGQLAAPDPADRRPLGDGQRLRAEERVAD